MRNWGLKQNAGELGVSNLQDSFEAALYVCFKNLGSQLTNWPQVSGLKPTIVG